MEAIAGRKSVEKRWSCRESERLVSKSLTVPIPKENHNVEYRHSRVADILQIGCMKTSTSHAEHGQLDLAVNIKYCRLYWTHVLIRHYFTTGRKYALI